MSVLSNRCKSTASSDEPAAEVLDGVVEPSSTLGFDGWTRIAGAGLAGTGLLHFAAPKLFVPLTRTAFPEQTERFVTVNGTLETLVGTALLAKRTRTFGFIGLLVYLLYLGTNAKKTRDEKAAEAAQPNVVPSTPRVVPSAQPATGS